MNCWVLNVYFVFRVEFSSIACRLWMMDSGNDSFMMFHVQICGSSMSLKPFTSAVVGNLTPSL